MLDNNWSLPLSRVENAFPTYINEKLFSSFKVVHTHTLTQRLPSWDNKQTGWCFGLLANADSFVCLVCVSFDETIFSASAAALPCF